jgi:hypothetical protein
VMRLGDKVRRRLSAEGEWSEEEIAALGVSPASIRLRLDRRSSVAIDVRPR